MKFNTAKIARKVVESTGVAPKPNTKGIELARRKFGTAFVNTLLKKKVFEAASLKPPARKKFEELRKFKYGPLVYEKGGKFFVKKTVGETVRLVYVESDSRCVALAKAIRDECWRRGAHVSLVPTSDEDSKKHLRTVPEHTLTEMPPLLEASSKLIDVRFYVGDKEEREWAKGLEARLKLSAPVSQRLFEIQDRRKVRWCLVGFPVKMKNSDYVVSRKKYEKVYLESLLESFSSRTKRLCSYYRKALEGTEKIRITADDGTDLSFSIKNRPILVADAVIDSEDMERGDVGLNIPDGEVFLAPLEHSANGKIQFDYVNIGGFGLVRNLWVHFRRGKVVDFSAHTKKQTESFRRFLDANTGEKDRIAEFGIGTNSKADFIGTTIVDEKIFGSIHIAIGNNTGAFHGKNKASSHQDMIKVMKGRGGNVFADGRLIMKNGVPAGKA